MNSRGSMLLPSETLKMVLGIICVMFLIFLMVGIYFSMTGKQEEAQAAATLDRIQDVFSNAKSNASFVSEDITDLNPAGWMIFIFTGPEKKPEQCTRSDCLCLCDFIDVNVADRQMKECNKDGVCFIESNLLETPDIKINKPKDGTTSIRVEKRGQDVGVWVI